MSFTRFLGAFSVIAVAVGVASAQTPQTPAELCAAADTSEPTTRQFAQPEQVLQRGVDYRAIFCTEAGPVYVDLFERYTPVTVNNFVFLAQQGYYNNTTFHRVLENFMAQGGDPTGSGAGGPGYRFEDEPLGFLNFDRPGLLAMANAGPATNGSQFFITTVETPWLNGAHTIFGDVIEGFETVRSLRLRDPQTATTPGARLDTVIIITDPASVVTTFEDTTPVATAEEFAAALSTSVTGSALPDDLRATQNGLQTLDEVIDAQLEVVRPAYRDLLTGAGFQYRVAVEVEQVGCEPRYGFDLLGYFVDAFETPEAATSVLEDGFLDELAAANGYTKLETDAGTLGYEIDFTMCDDSAGKIQWLIVQRGRYLATLYGSFNAEITAVLPINELLGVRISPIFESALGDIYRSELR
ncbi:peptidylprolyl isomerase [Aggregatilineales bacterium SYSU G02658]